MFPPIVTVSEGKLEGFTHTTSDGFQIDIFLGIPYAKPPVGDLRFKDPQPPEKWTGTRNATVQGNTNPQYILEKKKCIGNEDSLFLNVSVPSTASPESKLPVVCFIHGGGFYLGNGTIKSYPPKNLVEKDIILVTFNYRLGILGFMCLNTPEVPGNAGLKDQVFALRWIQKNIEFFGGDPQNVTIAGCSAGAACVHYHMISPMSKGLFHRAIMQSGSSLCEWAKQKDPLMHAFQIAEKLGMKKTSSKAELLNFLRKVPIEDLTKESIIKFDYEMDIWFCGVVEQQFPDCEPFLIEYPEKLMQTGNYNMVPTIYGMATHEGLFLVPPRIFEAVENDKFDISLDDLKVLVKRHTACDVAKDDLIAIKEFYLKKDKNIIQGFTEFISDMYFTLSISKTINISRMYSDKVFYYLNAYCGKSNKIQPTTLFPFNGATHGDEESYLFKDIDSDCMDPLDILNTKILVQMWTNFIKHGNPTPKTDVLITELWKPTTKDELYCLEINKDLKMFEDPFSERVKFMNSILCKYKNNCENIDKLNYI